MKNLLLDNISPAQKQIEQFKNDLNSTGLEGNAAIGQHVNISIFKTVVCLWRPFF